MFIKQIPPKALLPSCRFGMNVVRGASAVSLAVLLILTTWVGSAGAQTTGFQMRTQLVEGRVLPNSSFDAGYDDPTDYAAEDEIVIADADSETGSGGVANAILSSYADSDGRDEGSDVGIVDWVEVEFVAIPAGDTLDISPIPASDDTDIFRFKKVALLLSDGSIVDPGELNDATSQYELAAMLEGINDDANPTMPALTIPSGDEGLGDVSNSDIYIIVNHRNHVAVLSGSSATLDGEDYTYDFTTGVDQARGGVSALTQVTLGSASEYAMYGGDASQDGVNVTSADPAAILAVEGSFAYSSADISLDGNATQGDVATTRANEGAARQFTP